MQLLHPVCDIVFMYPTVKWTLYCLVCRSVGTSTHSFSILYGATAVSSKLTTNKHCRPMQCLVVNCHWRSTFFTSGKHPHPQCLFVINWNPGHVEIV